jgi:hypothetical protein
VHFTTIGSEFDNARPADPNRGKSDNSVATDVVGCSRCAVMTSAGLDNQVPTGAPVTRRRHTEPRLRLQSRVAAQRAPLKAIRHAPFRRSPPTQSRIFLLACSGLLVWAMFSSRLGVTGLDHVIGLAPSAQAMPRLAPRRSARALVLRVRSAYPLEANARATNLRMDLTASGVMDLAANQCDQPAGFPRKPSQDAGRGRLAS